MPLQTLCISYAMCIFNFDLPFLKFFLSFSVFVLLFDKVTVCDSDSMKTAAYNHLISRNYNINYFRLPDRAKSKTTISYWLVCPTNWSIGHFWIMLNYRSTGTSRWNFPLCASFLDHFSTPKVAACNELSVTVILVTSLIGNIVKLVTLCWWPI